MGRGTVVAVAVVAAGAALAVFLMTSRAPETPRTPPDTATAPALPPAATPASPPKAAPRATKPAEAPTPTAEATPTTATLRLESDVADATVFIDRVFIGSLPLTAPNVAPGSHQLTFSATGYDSIRMSVDVEPGPRTITARFKEVVLDERITVTHKHALGSCSGVLRATPQGLTYEASDKNDAFQTPLPSLEVFAVDYVAKNLKVKIRNGKTYNFADAEGNVDRLYAFHQAVDKARRRLISGDRP